MEIGAEDPGGGSPDDGDVVVADGRDPEEDAVGDRGHDAAGSPPVAAPRLPPRGRHVKSPPPGLKLASNCAEFFPVSYTESPKLEFPLAGR